MAKLVYTTIESLDGYIADESGKFDWAEPDAEVHAFVNDLERPIGTYLYGRRLYEVMIYWETALTDAAHSPVTQDYARIWLAADKVVYSKTLDTVSTAKTQLERDFDPEAVRRMKERSRRDLGIGGPHLAAQAIKAGLVDEYHFLVNPIVVGGGTPSMPDQFRATLELQDVRRFGSGVVHLHYRAT